MKEDILNFYEHNVTDMLVTNYMRDSNLLMGHREPTDLSVIQITCNIQYPGIPRISGKEKPRSCSVSKSMTHPDQDPLAEEIRYIGCSP
jgi:hypothetical protein